MNISTTNSTPELAKKYSRRMKILEARWNMLMDQQNKMKMNEIISDEFQAKRKRIGGLWHRMNKIIMKPRKDAVRDMLNGINHNMSNMPNGTTGISIL